MNASNGKILENMDTKIIIHDLEFKNGICALVGIVNKKDDSFLCFKSYKIDFEVVLILRFKKKLI